MSEAELLIALRKFNRGRTRKLRRLFWRLEWVLDELSLVRS